MGENPCTRLTSEIKIKRNHSQSYLEANPKQALPDEFPAG